MTGVTLRGAVRLKSGVTEFAYSTDDEGNGVISWASIPAGAWAYDVFMDKDGDESPLLYGCFVSAGRVTPDLPDEKQAIAGAVVVNLPEGSGCVNVVLGDTGSASYYAEQAKEANTQAQQAKSDAQTAATDAATSAGAAEDAATRAEDALASIPEVDAEGNMTLKGGLTAGGIINANRGINLVSELAAGAPKLGVNAGAKAVMDVLSNVYHIDYINKSRLVVLAGSNVETCYALAGWCGLRWAGTDDHKCVLMQAQVVNSNNGGAVSPAGASNYALVMSYISGTNMSVMFTKFGWTGYYQSITATAIEDIPGPSFYVDCARKIVVAKSAAGDITELPWTGLSIDDVSRIDLIVVPASSNSSHIYLSRHVGVVDGGGSIFNRSYLTPQVHYLGDVPLGLVSNDVCYSIVDTRSPQMAMFRVSIIQGINIADYLNISSLPS